MYEYRKLTPKQKKELLRHRKLGGMPLHEPPRLRNTNGRFLITATTYEHKHYFQTDTDRTWLLSELNKELQSHNVSIEAWVLLPNHYHLLVECQALSGIGEPLRRVHARTARELNRREGISGRRIWYRFVDRQIRNERHYYTTLNYIHYNPTKHRYVQKPREWTCSSLHLYEKAFGTEWLRDLWRAYPVRDYGKGWDW